MGPIPSFLIGLTLGATFAYVLSAYRYNPLHCYLCGDPLRQDEYLSVNPPYLHMDCRLAHEQAAKSEPGTIVPLPRGRHKKRRSPHPKHGTPPKGHD